MNWHHLHRGYERDRRRKALEIRAANAQFVHINHIHTRIVLSVQLCLQAIPYRYLVYSPQPDWEWTLCWHQASLTIHQLPSPSGQLKEKGRNPNTTNTLGWKGLHQCKHAPFFFLFSPLDLVNFICNFKAFHQL